jgi:hypothetical protein
MNEHLVIFKEQDKQLEELFKSVKRQKARTGNCTTIK